MTTRHLKLTYHQIDAFTTQVFTGNPAAVYVLDGWLDDATLGALAAEHNLSETAFVVPGADNRHELRWFTPTCEVELCGHATLASAWVLLHCLDGFAAPFSFATRFSGDLGIRQADGMIWMDFPAQAPAPLEAATAAMNSALGTAPSQWLASASANLAVFESAAHVAALAPDMRALARISDIDNRLMVATAAADDGVNDFVSRVFAPGFGVDEDPVTGSAHCTSAPYWAKRLGRNRLRATQLSARGGRIECDVREQRMQLGGHAVCFATGTVSIAVDGART